MTNPFISRSRAAFHSLCGIAIAAAAISAFALGPVHAATLTWDSDPATAGVQEGDGNWTPGGATFWNGSTNVATANDLATDIARFGNGGTLADVATIDTDTRSINGLVFGATNTNGYLLSSVTTSVLTVGAGGIMINSGAQATTVGSGNLTLALGANQTWTNSSANPLTLDAPLNGGGKLLTLSGTGPVYFAAGFSNLGLNSIFNTGTNVTITDDSTVNTPLFANGNTTISAGTTLSLNQIVVINSTGVLTVTDTGLLTGVQFRIGSTSGQAANLTVRDGGQVTAATSMEFSHAGGSVASNLNVNPGGTFTTPVGFTMTGVGAINFNGGTLKFTGTLADLRAGGAAVLTLNVIEPAIIDVAATKTVGVSQILAHAGADPADGGLIKTGAGILELKATNTYNGDTDVEGGTLALTTAYLNNFSTVTIAAGAVLKLNHSTTDAVAGLVLDGVVKADGVYNAANSGGLITGTGSILVDSTPSADDPLSLALAALRNHINGAVILTAAQINTHAATIRSNAAKLGTNPAIIADALSLVTLYETKKGALFVAAPTRGGYLRAATGFDLPNAILTLEQRILDNTYTATSLAANESLLRNWKIGSSAHFPGSVAPPADATASRSVPINASQPKVWGAPVMFYDYDARRPTGSYLAPGSIGIVTVPAALVNKGFKVRVGAHSWDLTAKDRIERIDRISRVYNITSTTTKVANPFGGGIYIEVPYLANAGLVSVQITNAVRSPFFSSTSFHRTTLSEWQDTERTQPGPWADFESDRFMMQVPRSWIYNFADPVTLMADWDMAMDAVSDLMGLPLIRPKTVMYAQVDVILRANVNAPGYPFVNDAYDPYTATNGNKSHYLLTGPQNSPWATLHELGHAHLFTKFTGEVESAVNLLYVAALNRKFGKSLDQAFGASIGAPGDTSTINLRYVSLEWTLKNVFRTGNKTMLTADMSYEHKGYAKYVEIANLFGWDAVGDFWRSVNMDFENGITYPRTNSDPTDSRIVRMSKAARVDLRPLLHFWGAPPLNATNVRNAINAAALPPSGAIYRRLKYYQAVVPTSQSGYNTFYYAIDGSGADTEIKALFTNKTYTTAIADSAKAAIQGIIDLYFPNGDPDLIVPPSTMWDVAPGTVGVGDGTITTAAGIWNTTTANWTNNAGANNALWVNDSNASFGSGTYTVTLASGVSVRSLTVAPGAGNLTLKAAADNGSMTVAANALWNINDNVLNINADAITDTKLTMASGHVLTVTGSGTFNTGEKPAGADWSVAGALLSAQGTLTLRGNALGVGKFGTISLAPNTSYFHEKNLAETYANKWLIDGTGQATFNSRYAVTPTYSGEILGTGGITFNGTAVLSAANSYAGATIVATGTLSLTGNRVAAAAGGITVGNVNNSTGTLNISNGNYTVGTTSVGYGNGTSAGILNQTGGSLTLSATQLIIGNSVTSTTAPGTGATGTYSLSGGTLTGAPAGTRGIIIGTNNGTTGTFNLSGTGNLVMDSSIVMVGGRTDAVISGVSGTFNQSAGSANIGTLAVAGGAGANATGDLTLTGGVFAVSAFPSLATANGSTATITFGGTSVATLPAFPTNRGSGSTATVYFNGGTLVPAAASTTYFGGLTNAFVKSGGAKFNIPAGRDITVSQSLLTDSISTGGGLTKSGTGKLTLSGASTYTGNTTVSAGTLELALGGRLKFVPKANGIANKITGSGTLSLKGAFAIDLSGAAAANGNSWTLVDAGTLAETYDVSFSVPGFTQSSNIWTKTDASGKWTFTEATGVLSYTATTGYLSWIAGFSVGTNNLPADDFDNDGLSNLLEYALNGDPSVSGTSILPQLTVTATDFEFTYSRLDLSLADTTQNFQYGSFFTDWTSIFVPAAPGVSSAGITTITVTDTGTIDSIKISVPKSAAVSGILFGRLQVIK